MNPFYIYPHVYYRRKKKKNIYTRAVQKVCGLRLYCSHLLICVYDFTRDIYENMSLFNSEKVNSICLQITILWQLQITRDAQSGARWWWNKMTFVMSQYKWNILPASLFLKVLFLVFNICGSLYQNHFSVCDDDPRYKVVIFSLHSPYKGPSAAYFPLFIGIFE
jgi:hypothetical protein